MLEIQNKSWIHIISIMKDNWLSFHPLHIKWQIVNKLQTWGLGFIQERESHDLLYHITCWSQVRHRESATMLIPCNRSQVRQCEHKMKGFKRKTFPCEELRLQFFLLWTWTRGVLSLRTFTTLSNWMNLDFTESNVYHSHEHRSIITGAIANVQSNIHFMKLR